MATITADSDHIGPASNADPYPQQGAAIAALASHFGLTLDRDRCFPYGR